MKMKKNKTYLVGNPETRAKLRVWWMSIVYAFALIGLGSVAFAVYLILTHL